MGAEQRSGSGKSSIEDSHSGGAAHACKNLAQRAAGKRARNPPAGSPRADGCHSVIPPCSRQRKKQRDNQPSSFYSTIAAAQFFSIMT
jgi:hypothetical protein